MLSNLVINLFLLGFFAGIIHKNQKVGLGTIENGLAASGFPPEGPKKERCAILCKNG